MIEHEIADCPECGELVTTCVCDDAIEREQEDIDGSADNIDCADLDELDPSEEQIFEVAVVPKRILDPKYRRQKVRNILRIFNEIANEFGVRYPREIRIAGAQLVRNYRHLRDLGQRAEHDRRQAEWEEQKKRKQEDERARLEREREQEHENYRIKVETEKAQKASDDQDIEHYREALQDPTSAHYNHLVNMPYQYEARECIEYLSQMPWHDRVNRQLANDTEMMDRFLNEVITECDLIEESGTGFVGRDAKDTVPTEEQLEERVKQMSRKAIFNNAYKSGYWVPE